jgi:hypothetical protein
MHPSWYNHLGQSQNLNHHKRLLGTGSLPRYSMTPSLMQGQNQNQNQPMDDECASSQFILCLTATIFCRPIYMTFLWHVRLAALAVESASCLGPLTRLSGRTVSKAGLLVYLQRLPEALKPLGSASPRCFSAMEMVVSPSPHDGRG